MSKECLNCKTILPDNAQFCSNCGGNNFATFAVEYPTNVNPPAQPPVQPYAPPVPPVQPNEPPKKAKKKKSKMKFIIPVVALVLVVAIMTPVLAVSAVKSSPLVKIGNGVSDLLTSQEIYEVNGSLDLFGDEVDFDGKFNFNHKDQTAFFDGKIKADGEKMTGFGYISAFDKKLILEANTDGYDFLWVDDYLNDDGDCYHEYEVYEFVMDVAPTVFAALDWLADPSDEKAENILNDAVALLEKYTDEEFDINVNSGSDTFNQIKDILSDDIKDTLLNKDWLADNLGFEQTKSNGITYHNYDFNLSDAAVALLEIVKNNKDELMPIAVDLAKDFIDDDMTDSEIEEELEEILEDLIYEAEEELEFLSFTLSVGYKGSDIKSIKFTLLDDDDEGIKFNTTIEKTNEGLDIDFDSYQKAYDDIVAGYESDY